jgi:hypothetical protein
MAKLRGEQRLYQRIKRHVNKDSTRFVYKIPDCPAGGISPFSPKKPFDMFIVSPVKHFDSRKVVKFVALELKSVKGKSIPFSSFRPHQKEALRKILLAGGEAYFFVEFGDRHTYLESVDRIDYLVNKYKGVRKSIPQDAFEVPFPVQLL